MDKYEFKIDSLNKRIIITDESGLNVVTNCEEIEFNNRPTLTIIDDPLDVNLLRAWINYKNKRKEMDEIKVGDRVTVINDGMVYPSYSSWFEEYSTIDIAARYAFKDKTNIEGISFRVIDMGPHDDFPNIKLCAIEGADHKIYLIDIKGLKKG